jgi:hypothetical protein
MIADCGFLNEEPTSHSQLSCQRIIKAKPSCMRSPFVDFVTFCKNSSRFFEQEVTEEAEELRALACLMESRPFRRLLRKGFAQAAAV